MEVNDDNQELSKDYLIDAAVASLRRLNTTINEMKKWTAERTALQNDIRCLQETLQAVRNDTTSVLLLRDPLIKQQSDEIRRLEATNDSMKSKLERLSNVLHETEQIIARNVDRKVRYEVAKVNSQVAEERLEFVREIEQLKKRHEELEANTTLQQIKAELEKFAESDRKLDNFLHQVTRKVIRTVSDLSSKLLKVNETLRRTASEKSYFHTQNLQLKRLIDTKIPSVSHLQYVNSNNNQQQEIQQINFPIVDNKLPCDVDLNYLHEIKQQVEVLQAEKEYLLKEKLIKERALKRNNTGVKTKLSIALMKNDKLNEKIKTLEHAMATNCDNTVYAARKLSELSKEELIINAEKLFDVKQWVNNHANDEIIYELAKLKSFNENLTNQLLMESTTTNETLKEFERSNKEIEKLEKDLKCQKHETINLKRELTKLRLENKELKDGKLINKKKNTILGEEELKEKEKLQSQNRLMNMKINRLNSDIKKAENKNKHYEMELQVYETEKVTMASEIAKLNEKLTTTSQIVENVESKNSQCEELIKKLSQEKENLSMQLEALTHKIEILQNQLDNQKTENFTINELLCKSHELNENLDDKCQKYTQDIQELVTKLMHSTNECDDMKINIEKMSTTIASLQHTEIQLKQSIDTLNIENATLKNDLIKINNENTTLKCQLNQLQSERKNSINNIINTSKETIEHFNLPVYNCDHVKNDDSNRRNIVDYKKKVTNKMINNSEKILLQSLQETERELMGVKSDLSEVKEEIGSLRYELDSGKFGLRNVENENYALKEELARLRHEKQRLTAAVRNLGKELPRRKVKDTEAENTRSKR